SIQSLRAVAAIMVFLCHLFAMEEVHSGRPEKLTSFWVNGAHGVDLFFVISGFVIVWVASDVRRGWQSAGDFLGARIARIYPTWWLFAGATSLMLWIARGTPWQPERMIEHGMHGPTHLLDSFLLLPQAHHPVLGVGWTLVHEMYFYAVFAALVLVLPAHRRLPGLLVWAAMVIVGASIGLTAEFADTFTSLIFYPMTLQFVAGALVAYLIKRGCHRFARASIALGAIGWAAAFLKLDSEVVSTLLSMIGLDAMPNAAFAWRRTIMFGVPSALLVYGFVASELRSRSRNRVPNPLVPLGDWSYSIYLCHVPVITVVNRLTYRPFGADQWWIVGAYLAFAIITTLIVAAAVYHLFERPTIAFYKRIRLREPRRADFSLATSN
ncbi:MAG: acyltransferase, partial [Pseudomonadota bacterium]